MRPAARHRPGTRRLRSRSGGAALPRPRESADFPGGSRCAGAKSLQPQTTWRWGESSANPSLGAESLLSRENTGNSVDSGPIEGRRGPEDDRFPATFGGISLEPGTGKEGTAIRELPAGDREAHGACFRRETVGASAFPAPTLESRSFPRLA